MLVFLILTGFVLQCNSDEPFECKEGVWLYEQCMKNYDRMKQEQLEKEQNNFMNQISKEQAVTMIQDTRGKFFGVEFTKKNSDEVREMNARIGVSKYVTGEGLKFDPVSKGLIPVYDVINKGYRMINVNGLMRLRTNGETYIIL